MMTLRPLYLKVILNTVFIQYQIRIETVNMEIDLNYYQELHDLAQKSYLDNDIRLALTIKSRVNGAIRVVFNQIHSRETLTMLGMLFRLEANISIFILSSLNLETMTLAEDPFNICMKD